MSKNLDNKENLFNLDTLQAWEQGEIPKELTSCTSAPTEQVRAYMLAHHQFLTSLMDILHEKVGEKKVTYEQIYDNLRSYVTDRAEIEAKWYFSH